eukprot:4925246-Pyramimonas_sp.AAC.1
MVVGRREVEDLLSSQRQVRHGRVGHRLALHDAEEGRLQPLPTLGLSLQVGRVFGRIGDVGPP